jgi:hypothetical protein
MQNDTYYCYVALVILCNPFPIAVEAADPHLKHMVISECLDSGIYVLKFRIYPHPVRSDNVHLHRQLFEVFTRRPKILQSFLT